MTDTAPLTDQQHTSHLRSRIFVILSENIPVGRVSAVTDEVIGLVQPELNRLTAEIDRLRAERDQFADRVDTLTAVAQSNAKAQRVAYEECERLRAALSAIESDAERAARKGYDLDPEDIRATAHNALTAAAPTT